MQLDKFFSSLDDSWYDDTIGSVDDLGWCGLVHGKRYSFVVITDTYGFTSFDTYNANSIDCNNAWLSIVDDYNKYYANIETL